MKFSMTGQEKVTFKYRWLLNRCGLRCRFDYDVLMTMFWMQESFVFSKSKELMILLWYIRVFWLSAIK